MCEKHGKLLFIVMVFLHGIAKPSLAKYCVCILEAFKSSFAEAVTLEMYELVLGLGVAHHCCFNEC